MWLGLSSVMDSLGYGCKYLCTFPPSVGLLQAAFAHLGNYLPCFHPAWHHSLSMSPASHSWVDLVLFWTSTDKGQNKGQGKGEAPLCPSIHRPLLLPATGTTDPVGISTATGGGGAGPLDIVKAGDQPHIHDPAWSQPRWLSWFPMQTGSQTPI